MKRTVFTEEVDASKMYAEFLPVRCAGRTVAEIAADCEHGSVGKVLKKNKKSFEHSKSKKGKKSKGPGKRRRK